MKFQPGKTGNPTGRPRGTGKRQKLFISLVEPHKNALFDTAIKLALNGSESMLRLFLDRLLPSKPTDDELAIQLPAIDFNRTQSLTACGESLIHAISQGDITPEQASSMMSILEAQRKNIETTELALRVAEMERTLKQRKKEKRA